MKVYIGSDHAGYELKEELRAYVSSLGYDLEDKGAFEFNPNDDYPDFIKPVAVAVVNDKESRGIVLGGSGQGEAICANKVQGIRCVVFYGGVIAKIPVDVNGTQSHDLFEIVTLARQHNNVNILSLGARFLTFVEAKQAVKLFLQTEFSGDERHIRRLNNL